MSAQMIVCPNCGKGHKTPVSDLRKASCTKCGCIIVFSKTPPIAAKGLLSAFKEDIQAAQESTANTMKTKATAAEAARTPVVRRRETGKDTAAAGPRAGGKPGGGRSYVDERRGTRRDGKPAVSPLMIAGLVALIAVIGLGVYYIVDRNAPKPNTPGDAGATAAKPAAKPDEEFSGLSSILGKSETPSTDPTPNPAASVESGASAVAQKPTKEDKSSKTPVMVPFEPTPGTSAEQIELIKKHITTLKDLGATRALGEAQDVLSALQPQAIPLLINALMELDRNNYEDSQRGWNIVQTLWNCAQRQARLSYDQGFNVFGRWPEAESAEFKTGADNRRRAVEDWWKWWDKNQTTWKPEMPAEDK